MLAEGHVLVSTDRQADGAAVRLPVSAFIRTEKSGVVSTIVPVDAQMRAVLQKKVSRRVHGVFASPKNGRSVSWRTRDQCDLMSLIEVDPAVLSYESEVERVSFVLDGRLHNHVPAFRARMARGVIVLDALSSQGADSPGRKRLVGALTEAYADRGIPYRALSGSDIRTEPRFGNARWVLARRAYQPTAHDILSVTGALSGADRLTVAMLRTKLPGVAEIVSVVCAMAVGRSVTLDLSAAVPEDMAVSLNTGETRR